MWHGFGLRNDLSGPSANPRAAQDAVPREAWCAFQRLASVLGDVGTGRVVLPRAMGRADLMARVGAWNDGQTLPEESPGFVVLEFQRSSLNHPYAYLVFYDPCVEDTNLQRIHADWEATARRTTAILFETIGQMDIVMDPPVRDASGQVVSVPLPRVVCSVPAETPLTLPTSFQPRGVDAPLLILASARIDWWVEEGASSASHEPEQPFVAGEGPHIGHPGGRTT